MYVYFVCTGQAVYNNDGAYDTSKANVYKNGAVKSRTHQITHDSRISFIKLRTCSRRLSFETRRSAEEIIVQIILKIFLFTLSRQLSILHLLPFPFLVTFTCQ